MKKIRIVVSVAVFSLLLAAAVMIIINNVSVTVGSASGEPITIGLIMNGSADDRSWNMSHAKSLERLSRELGLTVITHENVPTDERCLSKMNSLIEKENCGIIVCTSVEYGEYIERAAAEHPDVYFLHATGSISAKNVSSFFGRMYQIRYLSGIAAGLMTSTGHIGYVAAFPISEVNRGINAFTLGVRSANPEAVVHVSFCGSWTGDYEAEKSCELLKSRYDIDIMAMHTNSLAPLGFAQRNGIRSIGYNYDNSEAYPESLLTSCVWNWDGYYREQITAVRQGKFVGENLWLDTNTGIADLTDFAEDVPNSVISAVERARKLFSDRVFDVFYGPVRDNEGVLRIDEGESMSDLNMLGNFDWYTEGVDVVAEG